MKIKQYHWGVIYLVLISISTLLIWLNQHSINAYWQQTYHQPSYLQKLDEFRLWRKGGEFKAWLMNEPLPEILLSSHFDLEQTIQEEMMQVADFRQKNARLAFGNSFIQGELRRLGYDLDKSSSEMKFYFPPFEPIPLTMSWKKSIHFAVHPNEILTILALQNENEPLSNISTETVEIIEKNYPDLQENENILDLSNEENEAEVLSTQLESSERAEISDIAETIEEIKVLPSEENAVLGSTATISKSEEHYPNKIRLNKQDMVFFAGDSLMQGVAPYVQQWLTSNAIKSINLSKQSTGLSYPKFFNWPATVEETLQKNPQIKLLVMFLGPNDPWDFPHPEKPKSKYLRFKETEWENVYRQRISHILETARKFDVNVIWLQIPHMRAPKLNMQMAYLNEVLETETHNRALFIPIKAALSGGENEYKESIRIDGKLMRVRSKDGIHFTPSGMKLIANHIIQHIEIIP